MGTGVNTGFGGSADTRTEDVKDLQENLIRMLNYGVLPSHDDLASKQSSQSSLERSLPTEDPVSTNIMPASWVRAAMLIRINALMHGASGVRPVIVHQMLRLLLQDIIPKVPIHGSISASGDLSPLSYIGSAIEGKENALCTVGTLSGTPKTMTAAAALAKFGLQPQRVIAKEGLSLVNGTAMSCAVAGLALHDAHGLSVMSKLLTAMSVEALRGSPESFDPFFAQVRPHMGQIDSSRSIFGFLKGSKLINGSESDANEAGVLRQDRYSIRTASQWVGPVLEDLFLAHQQITTEGNSVTDNPLIDCTSDSPRFLHGGNFQARSITSAAEKIRLSLQTIGRMMFTQTTEMINPTTSFGLPPNLTAEEPSISFIMKGVDIGAAALLSELGFLANPVGTHVQTAEMGNQSLNSLALISARYALTSVDIASKLVALHLLVVCQAIDLRVINILFLKALDSKVFDLTKTWLSRSSSPDLIRTSAMPMRIFLSSQIRREFDRTTQMDTADRFNFIAETLQPTLLKHNPTPDSSATGLQQAVASWTAHAAAVLRDTYTSQRDRYLQTPDPTPFLGRASRRMHAFVRKELHVPFLTVAVLSKADNGHGTPMLGTFVTRLYEAVRNGVLYAPAMECLKEAQNETFARPSKL